MPVAGNSPSKGPGAHNAVSVRPSEGQVQRERHTGAPSVITRPSLEASEICCDEPRNAPGRKLEENLLYPSSEPPKVQTTASTPCRVGFLNPTKTPKPQISSIST